MTFSGALTLTDLNDFLTPSQACIKPVEQVKLPEDEKHTGTAATEIRIDSDGAYYEVYDAAAKNAERKLQQAQISLNDCLACSGCITSAESVLITLQSHAEVLNFLNSNPPPSSSSHRIPVLSISPQSLASLAASLSSGSHSQISTRQVLRRVEVFCKQVLGFEHVYDTTFSRHIALLEHTREFWERKRGTAKLPMLASACPGWICYAEKTHAEMLPFVSCTKSPQQIMGTLIKSWLGEKWHKQPDQIYHVSVMPCYDKKLEASRPDFYNEHYSTRDVDCVITTGELDLMMREKGWNLSVPTDREDLPQFNLDSLDPLTQCDFPELLSHPGTSSGSYLHSLITAVGEASPAPLDLSVRTVRSSDYEEYTLRNQETGEVIFRGAKCYGFRNLQNVVRKVGRQAGVQVGKGAAGRLAALKMRTKKNTADAESDKYDYVEVMACPSGCVNGGGQLRPSTTASQNAVNDGSVTGGGRVNDIGGQNESELAGTMQGPKWGGKELTQEVEKAYWHGLPTPPPSPSLRALQDKKPNADADQLAARIMVELCVPKISNSGVDWFTTMDDEAELKRTNLFRTQYRAVESEVVGLAVKW